ncbi:MAG TPA: RNA polymerase sigma factor [Thermoanaerobaculia bacterium]|jgi:RNA polymerase sigma-70 factor (ECF subfamily)
MTPADMEAELEGLHAAGFAWALSCCGRRREDALDALQTSYLKILDGRAKFAGHSSFKTFLFAVIRKTASEQRRRNALRGILLGSWNKRAEPAAPAAEPEKRLDLLKALSSLARRQRQVLELVFYLGMTIEEAAETLAISVGSARVHYSRGKRRLARLLGLRGGVRT